MTSTYEMIKVLPGKGTNWQGLVTALYDNFLETYKAGHGRDYVAYSGDVVTEWNLAKGVRQLREAAWQAACFAVDEAARRGKFIPPSDETLRDGGFLGGQTVVWTDETAREAAEARIAQIIAAVA